MTINRAAGVRPALQDGAAGRLGAIPAHLSAATEEVT
jgi:hypothetical protein